MQTTFGAEADFDESTTVSVVGVDDEFDVVLPHPQSAPSKREIAVQRVTALLSFLNFMILIPPNYCCLCSTKRPLEKGIVRHTHF